MPNLTIQSPAVLFSKCLVSLGKGEAIQASNYTEDAAMKYGDPLGAHRECYSANASVIGDS